MGTIEGLLLDVDGVLTEVWRPLPGAGAALAALRERGLPFLLATNTTTHTRGDLATLLAEAGLEVAPLVAMHRNPSWTTAEGLMMDSGPFIAALERVTGVEATVTGKPSPEFFRLCVERLGLPRERVAMVGDNLASDVLAAQACGLRGVLVRTGGFDQGTLAGRP